MAVEKGDDGTPVINDAWLNQTVAEQQAKLQDEGRIKPMSADNQHTDTRDGETIAGSTGEDEFDETTVILPSYIDENDLTEKQLRVLKNRILYPEKTQKQVGAMSGVKGGYISRIINKHLTDETRKQIHKQKIKRQEGADGETVVSVQGAENVVEMIAILPEYVDVESLTTKQENAMTYGLLFWGEADAAVGRKAGVSGGYIPMTMKNELTEAAFKKFRRGDLKEETRNGTRVVSIEGEPEGTEVSVFVPEGGEEAEPEEPAAPEPEPEPEPEISEPDDATEEIEEEAEAEIEEPETASDAPETETEAETEIEEPEPELEPEPEPESEPTPEPEPELDPTESTEFIEMAEQLAAVEQKNRSAIDSLESLQPLLKPDMKEAVERVLETLR